MKCLLPWGLVALLACVAGTGRAGDVEVTGGRVNLRSAPDINAEIVGQAVQGDRLAGGEPTASGWMPVAMPETLSAWVYEPLARDGVVQVAKLQMRAGPGINYRVLGTVEKGRVLTVRGRQTDWLEVAPTSECRVWISAAYVRPFVPEPPPTRVPVVAETPDVPVTEAPPPEPEPKPPIRRAAPERVPPPVTRKPPPIRKPPMPADGPGQRAQTPDAAPVPSGAPTRADLERRRLALGQSRPAEPTPAQERAASDVSVPAGRDVIPGGLRPARDMPQGQAAEYAGRLRRAGFIWNRPARYRVIGQDDKGRAVTLCYLMDAGRDLDRLVGKTIVVSGREYWAQGLRLPVLMAESIVVAE